MKKIIFSFLLSMFVVAIVAAQPPQRSMGPRGKGPRPTKENVEALKNGLPNLEKQCTTLVLNFAKVDHTIAPQPFH